MMTRKTAHTTATAAALGLLAACAHAQVVGFDFAANAAYDAGWADASNGGFGLGPWSFASETGGGFAGRFIADENSAGPSNVLAGTPARAWALFANNGPGNERSAAFRAFDLDMGDAGTSVSITLEHGFIATGGKVGLALRTGNANAAYADITTGALAQLFFEGGDGNFTVVDAGGETDTGAGFGLDGIVATFNFTGGGAFDLVIQRFFDEQGGFDTITVPGLSLGSADPIQSIAIFNDDGGDPGGLNNDAYFNSLTLTIPAPAGSLALAGLGLAAARRRR